MSSISSLNFNEETAHDFNNENLMMMVLGGYVVLKKPVPYFLLNVLHLLSVFIVYVYLIIMAIITIVLSSTEKVITVQTMQALCLLLVGLALPGVKLYTYGRMENAIQLLKEGVHDYAGEEPDEEHYDIKSERVSQVRNMMSWVTKLCFFCAFSNTFVMPIMRFMSAKGNDRGGSLQPYLPLPIHMVFDTREYLGFGLAFFTNAVFFFFLYGTIACLIETYLSCSLQLIAQLEILNNSLRKVGTRARLKLLQQNVIYHDVSIETLYNNVHFQKQLYLCLRENIIHHHAILRLTKNVGPFLEAINSICILSFSIVLAASIILIAQNPTINIALIGTLASDVICYYEMCKVGQEITDKSADIFDSIYLTPWPFCEKKFNVLLRVMLTNTRKPIIIRATGFNASASLGTYADMISAAYKIINILR